MPDMDGIKATFEIRKYLTHQRSIPKDIQPFIAGVTGHVHEKFKIEGYKAGMDHILSKPCYL